MSTVSEKHKFMEEHGEMPSAGPVISGVKPPLYGWKYVTKSAYMMEDKDVQPIENEEAETKVKPVNFEYMYMYLCKSQTIARI